MHIDESGRQWRTAAQLMEHHGVSDHWVGYWSKQSSIIHPKQMALRAKLISNKLPGNREQIAVCLDDDAQGILAGNEAKRPGGGSW
jgi:hypothetical protein